MAQGICLTATILYKKLDELVSVLCPLTNTVSIIQPQSAAQDDRPSYGFYALQRIKTKPFNGGDFQKPSSYLCKKQRTVPLVYQKRTILLYKVINYSTLKSCY